MGVFQHLAGRFRPLHYLLAALIAVPALPIQGHAQADEATIKNIVFKVTGSVVEVYYDLVAQPGHTWVVTLTLKRRFAKGFIYLPLEVSGDVGRRVAAGENRKIRWNIATEFPEGLPGEDCFFAVDAVPDTDVESGISTTYWIAGGAAVAGGILTVILLSKGSKAVPPQPAGAFPSPPGRP